MLINNTYALGEIVYLVTDKDQNRRIITAVIACLDGGLLYELTCGTEQTKHYEAELSYQVDVMAKM